MRDRVSPDVPGSSEAHAARRLSQIHRLEGCINRSTQGIAGCQHDETASARCVCYSRTSCGSRCKCVSTFLFCGFAVVFCKMLPLGAAAHCGLCCSVRVVVIVLCLRAFTLLMIFSRIFSCSCDCAPRHARFDDMLLCSNALTPALGNLFSP